MNKYKWINKVLAFLGSHIILNYHPEPPPSKLTNCWVTENINQISINVNDYAAWLNYAKSMTHL